MRLALESRLALKPIIECVIFQDFEGVKISNALAKSLLYKAHKLLTFHIISTLGTPSKC